MRLFRHKSKPEISERGDPALDTPPDGDIESENLEGLQLEETQSRRRRMGSYLKDGLATGALKGKLALEKAAGLGHRPNVIPSAEAIMSGPPRVVEIGWHPVGGLAGKWFAEKTGLGKMITEKVNKYPDPTQHWAVLVGDYCHQLWMDEHLDVIYINEKIVREEWHTFEVGKTTFNDEALRQTGEMTIYNMRQKRPAYNLISNNCQNFALLLLEATQVGAHREFGTTFAIYQRATGKGKIMDLFIDDQQQVAVDADQAPARPENHESVNHAQQVMHDNTTHLDCHHGPIP